MDVQRHQPFLGTVEIRVRLGLPPLELIQSSHGIQREKKEEKYTTDPGKCTQPKLDALPSFPQGMVFSLSSWILIASGVTKPWTTIRSNEDCTHEELHV